MPIYDLVDTYNPSFTTFTASVGISVTGTVGILGSLTASQGGYFNNDVTILGGLTVATFTASSDISVSGNTVYNEPGGAGQILVGWLSGTPQISTLSDDSLIFSVNNTQALKVDASAVTSSINFVAEQFLTASSLLIKKDASLQKDFIVNGSLTGSGRNIFNNAVVISGTTTTGFVVKADDGTTVIRVACVSASGKYLEISPSIAGVAKVLFQGSPYQQGLNGIALHYDATPGWGRFDNTISYHSGATQSGFKVCSNYSNGVETSISQLKEIFRAGNIGTGKEVVGIGTASVEPAASDITFAALYGHPTTKNFTIFPAGAAVVISGNLRQEGSFTGSGKSIFLNDVCISGTSNDGFAVKNDVGAIVLSARCAATASRYVRMVSYGEDKKILFRGPMGGQANSFSGILCESNGTTERSTTIMMQSGALDRGFIIGCNYTTSTPNTLPQSYKEIFRAGNIGTGKEVVGIGTASAIHTGSDTTLATLYGHPTTKNFTIVPAGSSVVISGNLRIHGYISSSQYPKVTLYAGTTGSDATTYYTHNLQSWTKHIRIVGVGSGGGGGSGRRGASLSGRYGGTGGGGGGMSEVELNIIGMPQRTLYCAVANGGTGGAAPSADDTNGNAGNPGDNTIVWFGTNVNVQRVLFAGAGVGGVAGTTSAPSVAGAHPAKFAGGVGGAGGSSNGSNGSPNSNYAGGGGGGGGGGLWTTDVASTGGNGGGTLKYLSTSAAAGGAAGQNGVPAYGDVYAFYSGDLKGHAGASGGGSHATTPGRGGDVLWWQWGGGGGGGGACQNGTPTAARGGNGGPGMVAIIEW